MCGQCNIKLNNSNSLQYKTIFPYNLIQNVQKMKLGSWGHLVHLKEELRCALIGVGLQYVMMDGDQRMLKLFADNSDILAVVGKVVIIILILLP